MSKGWKEASDRKVSFSKFLCLKVSIRAKRKNITSLIFSRQKPEGISQQYSVIRDDAERSNSEMNQLVHASRYVNDKYALKSSKARKGKELKFKHPGSTNCPYLSDDIECDVMNHGNDVTVRDPDVNRLVARKHYASRKQSLVHSKGILKSSLSICKRTFTQMALLLVTIICILGGLFDIKLPERESTIGTSPNLSLRKPLIDFVITWLSRVYENMPLPILILMKDYGLTFLKRCF